MPGASSRAGRGSLFNFGRIMVTFWVMDGPAQSEHAASHKCLGCRVLGLTLLTVQLHNMLRPVHLQAWWVVFVPTCAQGLVEPSSRGWGLGENKWSTFWGVGPPFVNPGVCPPGQHLDSLQEGASSQLSASIPLWRCTSPSRGRARWVGWTALATVTTLPIL